MSHSGSYVQLQKYRIGVGGGEAFDRSSVEQDLRDMVEHKPHISQHCHAVVKKANIIPGCINRSIAYMSDDIFLLYLASVRPQL